MKTFLASSVAAAMMLSNAPSASSGDLRLVEAAKHADWTSARVRLRAGADVNERHLDGSTALLWAVYHDSVEVVQHLLAIGADVNAANEYGQTPLSIACQQRNVSLARRLLEAGANPNHAGSNAETALMAVADMGASRVDLVKLLVAYGADVNAREATGGQTALMWAAVRDDVAIANALIDAGADIGAATKAGSTPLHFAAQQGALSVAQLLLERGADPNATLTVRQIDQETQAYVEVLTNVTPLWLAMTIRHEELGALLLRHGANPNAGHYRNIPPLHFAVLGGMTSLTKALLAYGADPNGRAPVTAFPPQGAEENLIGHKTFYLMPVGATPLLVAAQNRDPSTMRLLLDAGADPGLAADDGTTPLMTAAGVSDQRYRLPAPRQQPDAARALEAVKVALATGAAINAANESGQTALHGAAGSRLREVVEFLIESGANAAAENSSGLTPLDVAERDVVGTSGAQRQQAETIAALLRKVSTPSTVR